jgi:DNA-binding MarR family transcriptional regulator
MKLRDELYISKPLEPGQEIMLAILLTREYVARLSDDRLFKPARITDQQFNVLRILRGGPPDGYLVREIRHRMISHSADVPRLVERMARAGLVARREDPAARLAPIHSSLCGEVAAVLEDWESKALLGLLQQLRDGIATRLAPE